MTSESMVVTNLLSFGRPDGMVTSDGDRIVASDGDRLVMSGSAMNFITIGLPDDMLVTSDDDSIVTSDGYRILILGNGISGILAMQE